MTSQPQSGDQLRTTISSDGTLTVSRLSVPVKAPGDAEVLIRIEATPINPSDLALLLGPADMAQAASSGSGLAKQLKAPVPANLLPALKPRLDEAMPVGNEGAGVVIAAGADPAAQALIGKTVGLANGAMYAQYATAKAIECMVMPTGVSPQQAASCIVNPLTALSMVETMKREGHKAIIHAPAASNLGQMLVRLCQADGVPLVNIVRSAEQVALLKGLGAEHVLNSQDADFKAKLIEAIQATGATLAFDAIGGGKLASLLLTCMETVASRTGPYSRYGSSVHKQVYIYGALDLGPTELNRTFGLSWGVGGWLLTPFLQKIGMPEVIRLRQRVAAEITTTFASAYTDVISFDQALEADIARAYARKATGSKYLIAPHA
jgi:NADPH:quinone reductase